ncbi:hypothetical protein ACIQM4_12605 [Streptomyces sp. NPDC091272]|uniref:hypothetical protein n=1 Tax=Streptomyces sp. NPDC091272 TaxID=3365981 RepID=UPI0038172787
MNEQLPLPVRLPASRIPEGTAPWRSADARTWLAAVPSGRWTRPVWPALVLVATVLWALLAVATPPRPHGIPEPPLLHGTTAGPGGYGAGHGAGVRDTVRPHGSGAEAGDTAEVGGSGAEVRGTGGTARLTVSTTYSTTSGPADGFGRFDPWWLPTALLGLLLLELYWIRRRPALALAVLTPLTVAGLGHDDVLGVAVLPARIAVLVAAVLVAFHLAHRLALGVRQRARAVDAAGPARHPLPPARSGRPRGPLLSLLAGVLLLGMAAAVCGQAEHEESQWILLTAGTLGTALLVSAAGTGLQVWRRRRPQPALRVLVREGEDGRTWVYAADDGTGSEPLLGFRSWGAYEGEPTTAPTSTGPAGTGPTTAGPTSTDPAGTGPTTAGPASTDPATAGSRPLREAVLYGVPAPGAVVAYIGAVDGADGRVTVEHSTTPAVLAPRHLPALPHTSSATRPDRHRGTENGTPVSTETPSPSSPLTTVRSWSAGPVARLAALLLFLVESGALWAFLEGDRGWRVWFTLVLLPFTLSYIATGLNWRVTADRSGLWIAGAWRVRQLRWTELEKVGCDEDSLTFRGPRGVRVLVRPTGWAPLDRRTARGHVAGHAAREIRAMLAAPELRPTDDSTPGDQGMPLGPVFVLIALLGMVAALAL